MTLPNVDGMPIKGTGDSGDSMLWSGLMTSVGYKGAVEGIKKCQTADGRMWRCVDRVENQPQNGFSRDMALGVILYVVATKDYDLADKWIAYIKQTGGLFPRKEASDTRYLMTPTMWWLMSYAGIKVPLGYRLTRWLHKPYHKLEMRLSPKGYQTHLQAVTDLVMALATGKRDVANGKYLSSKEPHNAFFMWLAGNVDAALAASETFEAMNATAPGSGSQWCWERTDSEEAWRNSMGWDFMFIRMLCALQIK